MWCILSPVLFQDTLHNSFMEISSGQIQSSITMRWISGCDTNRVVTQAIYGSRAIYGVVITFLPRSKCLSISWLQSPFAVILEPKKIKCITASTFSPVICHEEMGLDAIIFVFWMLRFKPAFALSSFTLIKRLFSSFCFLPLKWYHLHIWGCWYFSQQSGFQLCFIQPIISHDVICI